MRYYSFIGGGALIHRLVSAEGQWDYFVDIVRVERVNRRGVLN